MDHPPPARGSLNASSLASQSQVPPPSSQQGEPQLRRPSGEEDGEKDTLNSNRRSSHVNVHISSIQREDPTNSTGNNDEEEDTHNNQQSHHHHHHNHREQRQRRPPQEFDDLFDIDDTTAGENTSRGSSEYSEYSSSPSSSRNAPTLPLQQRERQEEQQLPLQHRSSTPYRSNGAASGASGVGFPGYGSTGRTLSEEAGSRSATAVYEISMEAVANALQLPAHTLSVSLSRSNKLMSQARQQQQPSPQSVAESNARSSKAHSTISTDISSPIIVHRSPVLVEGPVATNSPAATGTPGVVPPPLQAQSITSPGRQPHATPGHMSFVQRVGSALRTPQFTSHHAKLRAGITSPVSGTFHDDLLPEFNLGCSKKDSASRFDSGLQASISPVSGRQENRAATPTSTTSQSSSTPVQLATSPSVMQGSVQKKVGFLSVSSRATRGGADDFIVIAPQSQRTRPDSLMSYGSASPTSVARSYAAGDAPFASTSVSTPSRLREFVARTHDSATMFGRSGTATEDTASAATASDAGDSLLGSEYSRDRRTMSTSAKSVHSDLHEPLLGGSEHSRSGTPVKPKKKVKRVHFPDNVINSVSVIQAEEQLSLLVSFHRPWYAHGIFLLASAFFVLSFCFLTRSCVTSTENTPVAVATLSCITFCCASLYLLAYLMIVWRPDDDEREFIVSCPENRRVLYAWTSGVVALLSLVGSYAIHVNGASLVSFMCTPLITTYLYEEVKKHSVSLIDAIGSLLVLGGLVVLTVGEDWVTTKPAIESVAVVAVTLVGGIAMSIFLFLTRSVSQHISNFFILTSTMVAAAIILFAIAYPLGGLDVPIGKAQRPITDLSDTDFFNLCMSGMFLFLSWFAHHFGSLYFDRMTVAGGFSVGAPLAIISFAVFQLPHADLPFEICGGIAVTVGCVCVLVSGWKFRQNVEVRIALEAE